MAKKAYVGVNNIARQVKNIYVGVNGTARKVVKGYVGVGGKARQFWPTLEKMYVIFKGRVNDGHYTLDYLNRYPTHSTDTPIETTTNSFASIMKKLAMVKTSGVGVVFPTRGFGFDQFWENDDNSDQWTFVNANQAIQKTNTSTTSADSTNRLYIPINRIYLPKNSLGKFICQIKVDAKGTITPSLSGEPSVTIGLHYIDSNNDIRKFSDVDVPLLEDYSEQEFTLDNPSYSESEAYVDYVSLNSFFNQDGYSTYVAVRNLLIQNAVYKNCLMVEEGAQLGFQSYCPVPVKKNSITIQYNGQTLTVNKVSGDDDVYFAWYYQIEEYGNISYLQYYAMIGVYAFSTKSFTTDGNYHASATAGTYKDHSYAGIDTAYLQQTIGYRIGINDFPDIPKCDITPMSVPTGITAWAIQYLGDSLIYGKYYDADGVAHNTY